MGIVVAVWWGCSGKPSFLPCKEPACTALPQQALRRTIGAVQRLNRKECEELWLYFTAREDTVPTAVSCIVPAEMSVQLYSEAHVLQRSSMWSILIIGPLCNAVLGIIIWKAAYFSLKVWIVYCIRVQWTMDLVVEQMQCGECMVVKLMVFTA